MTLWQVWRPCYFLLNFVQPNYDFTGGKEVELLLFSFEFCCRLHNRWTWRLYSNTWEGLLFSFEFCSQISARQNVSQVDETNLAIFFWILSKNKLTIFNGTQQARPCYFLLNFVCMSCRALSLACCRLVLLAIFFWILSDPKVPLRGERLAVSLLFSFEFCQLAQLFSSEGGKELTLAIFFWILYGILCWRYIVVAVYRVLLFSFEFCFCMMSRIIIDASFSGLLFSFEFCRIGARMVVSKMVRRRTCYFLLNFVYPQHTTWQPYTRQSCYFLLNFVCSR